MIKKIFLIIGLIPITMFAVMFTIDYYQIDPDICRNCGNCQSVCSNNAVYYEDTLGVYQIRPDSCEACGDCLEWCAHDAIDSVSSDVEHRKTSKRVIPTLKNKPDPFSVKTKIQYSLPPGKLTDERNIVSLQIFNTKGKLVKSMRINTNAQNTGTVIWKGRNNNGQRLPSGDYFLRLKGLNFASPICKCTLVK